MIIGCGQSLSPKVFRPVAEPKASHPLCRHAEKECFRRSVASAEYGPVGAACTNPGMAGQE
jgi:hypothetical protein